MRNIYQFYYTYYLSAMAHNADSPMSAMEIIIISHITKLVLIFIVLSPRCFGCARGRYYGEWKWIYGR